MENMFKELFNMHVIKTENSNYIKELKTSIEKNSGLLKLHMSSGEKKLLLRIIDAKDLIKEESSFNSFIQGFKAGMKMGYEVNRK